VGLGGIGEEGHSLGCFQILSRETPMQFHINSTFCGYNAWSAFDFVFEANLVATRRSTEHRGQTRYPNSNRCNHSLTTWRGAKTRKRRKAFAVASYVKFL